MHMKHRLFIALVAVIAVACKSEIAKGPNGVTYNSAVQYNEYIVERQARLMKNILGFVELAESRPDTAQKMLDQYVNETGIMITELKGMPSYGGDSALR